MVVEKINIALDGPAGAGKSTLAKGISEKLQIYYLDTGAMYRAFAYHLLSLNKKPAKKEDVLEFIDSTDIIIKFIDKQQRVFAREADVTDFIRTPEVSKGASDIAVFPEVRIKLVKTQRQVASDYDVVMDGRDIGTYVLPSCKNKFYIIAKPEIRARRRYLELLEKGYTDIDEEQLKNEIIYRDNNDSSREFAPLKCADDAIIVDTSDMSAEQTVEYVLGKIKTGERNLT